LDGLGSEGDLRNENENGLSMVEAVLGGLKVHFGLSAPGHSVEKNGLGLGPGVRRQLPLVLISVLKRGP
jgi:hypothetical protein